MHAKLGCINCPHKLINDMNVNGSDLEGKPSGTAHPLKKGKIKYFLRIAVAMSKDEINIQKKHSTNLTKKRSKQIVSLMDTNLKLMQYGSRHTH